jgi:hypothetical protein
MTAAGVRRWGGLALATASMVLWAVPLQGQQPAGGSRLLPEVRYLRMPLADPTAPRISAALMSTDLLRAPGPERPPFNLPDAAASAREAVAAVGIGAIFPLFQLAEWEGGGAILAVDGRVFARFRVEYPTRDDMGQDWYVGGVVEAARHRWSGRVGVIHRSAHLGDEFLLSTEAERIEFGGEQLDLMAAWEAPGHLRLYGGGAWVFRSYLPWEPRLRALGVQDRATLQLGMDGAWPVAGAGGLHLVAGADYYSAERTGWHPAFAAAAGVGVGQGRTLRLLLRGFSGRSHMGEFFLTPERYLALEMAARF